MSHRVNPKVPAATLGNAVSAIFMYYAGVPARLTWAFAVLFGFACGWITPDSDA